MRLAEMKVVHPLMARDKRCAKCQEVVGIYPSGQRVLREMPGTKVICNRCYEGADVHLLPMEVFEEQRASIPNPVKNRG
jgi:hypothetical protein